MPVLQPSTSRYTAFISYAREDAAFARQLEGAIETHQSLKAGAALSVFRDESDFTGSEYARALQGHLEQSASLIVVCSPNARRSTFVGDEIERFAALHGAQRIFPVLVDGLPDNEADDRKSFPPALLAAVGGMPLAADFRGFERASRRFADPRFESEWFKLLANLQDASPAEIRATDKQLQLRGLRRSRIRWITLLAVTISVAAAMLLLWMRARRAEQSEQEISARSQTELSVKNLQVEDLKAQLQRLSGSAQTPAAQPAPAAAGGGTATATRPPAYGDRVPPSPPKAAPPPTLAPSNAESAAPAPVAPEILPRVYFHIRDDSQRPYANQLKGQLPTSAYIVPGIQRLTVGPSAPELRYFRKGDEAEARGIANLLKVPGLVVKLVPGYETSTDIRPRHYELWLAPPGS
ncbi:MAG TPA: toll/interleukin-1 receptor domain-containing protein [Vicinamibacterales bacterium]|nr:toll/interleukin-1 receptor domain-containing protein [Vicinamibacterales bacterium]